MNLPELLAPAGTFECLKAAFDHGADAVYVGLGHFNLRARSGNFTLPELIDAIKFAKANNRKIYGTLNVMPSDLMLGQIEAYLKSLALLDDLPNALIVSDPGVIALCKCYLSHVPLHLSTQTGTFNCKTAQFWKDNGVSRIVLPREMPLEQIKYLTSSVSVETEIFIHGAMCVSIAGRCLLGAYLANRHANWGDCPQPCRLKYKISPVNENASDQWLTVEEFTDSQELTHEAYILNSKDLNTLPLLPQIIQTGVSSLKIEGRNKSPHYVGSVVKVYREALDAYLENPSGFSTKPQLMEELDRLDHRAYTTGFYGNDYTLQDTGKSQTISGLRVVGSVKGVLTSGEAIIDVKNPFTQQDVFNVLPVKKGVLPYNMELLSLTDINGNLIDRAITHRVVLGKGTIPLMVGDMLRKIELPRKAF